MKRPYGLAVVMLVCAGLVAAAVGTRAWATASDGSDSKYIGDTVALGLFSIEACNEGRPCRTYDWEAERIAEDMPVPGTVSIARALAIPTSIIAVVLLGLCGCCAAGGVRLSRALVYPAVSVAFLVQIAFVGAAVTWDSFAPGYSALLALVGSGAGAAIARAGLPRKVAAPPPPPLVWPPPPPCGWCSAALQWSPNDHRWWCTRCFRFA